MFDMIKMWCIIIVENIKKPAGDGKGAEAKEGRMPKVSVKTLWQQYAAAMSRRRPDSVLPISNFRVYLRRPEVAIIGRNGSYVIGQWQGGVFHPTHFAPRGPKSSVELLRGLARNRRILWAVTPDLAGMLRKLGYLPAGIARCDFRGEKVWKVILVDRPSTLAVVGGNRISAKVEAVAEWLRGKLPPLAYRLRALCAPKSEGPIIDEDALYKEDGL